MVVPELAKLCEPWQSLFGDNRAVATSVTAAHVLSLLVGGGLAIAADRTTLRTYARAAEERTLHLRELGAVHRPVLISLAVLMISGVLLAAADVETYATNWIFWTKMALIALLLANGALLTRTENRLRTAEEPDRTAGWRRLRTASIASLALWTLTALAGEILTGFA
jgi:uncharacterized membrane protein